MDHVERAKELFFKGYNCAQSVFAAFSDVTGIDEDTAIKLTSGFGAGMGALREVCGAVTGMFMVADMLYGYTSPTDAKGKAAHYELIRELAVGFKAENGSIICRELIANCPKGRKPMERTDEYYGVRPCTRFVADAAAILDRKIAEMQK